MARRQFRIVSARLTVRPLARPDITEFTRYRNVPEIARYQDWELPYTRDSAHRLVDDVEALGAPSADQWMQLAIEVSRDHRLVGDLAVWLDGTEQLAMIGYTIAPEAQRNGYATEAVEALITWLFRRGVRRVAATLDPANLASARVLERCGFRYIGTATEAALVRGAWCDDARFELLVGDWRAWRARTPARTVELVEITGANVREVGELDRAFSQRRFVSSIAQSFGDALVADEYEGRRIVPWYRAISADDQPAGFVMVAEPSGHQPHPYVWRFLVDWRQQGLGIGRRALRAVGSYWGRHGATHLVLGCVAGVPGSPEPFYRRLGFEPTGRVVDGETEMIVSIERLLG